LPSDFTVGQTELESVTAFLKAMVGEKRAIRFLKEVPVEKMKFTNWSLAMSGDK
jgi:hypothetical protein